MERVINKTCPECGNGEAYLIYDHGTEIEYECAQCNNLFTEYFQEQGFSEYDE